MKKTIFFLLLFGVVGFSSFSAFAQCDRSIHSPIQCGYYDEGYQDGANDARGNRSNDFKRYKSKVSDRKYESFYIQGYEAGYINVMPSGGRWNSAQRSAYDSGYRYGENDRRRNLSRSHLRYEAQYDRNYELYFQQGYFDGYDRRARQYDMPIGNYPMYPTYPMPPGTNTGTISWSGRVDNRVNIVIQGSNIRNDDVTNSGFQQVSQNMNGVLPRRVSTVSVRKTDGRGTAFVAQQPNRSNDYTAIVQVSDPEGGSDNYRLQISWQASTVEEPYRAGRVVWRGRVDQTANIIITGGDVQTQNVAGNGVFNINFNITGYLARRVGTVNMRKRDGRGTVTILQQPNWDNDFTAVIQISDPDRSDDNYEVEITW
jgi:hypothetical protein